jgi:hypothetical protein
VQALLIYELDMGHGKNGVINNLFNIDINTDNQL